MVSKSHRILGFVVLFVLAACAPVNNFNPNYISTESENIVNGKAVLATIPAVEVDWIKAVIRHGG